MRSLESIEAKNGAVHLRIRDWDGIDRPDYTTLELPHAIAGSWATRFAAAALEAREQAVARAVDNKRALEAKRESLATAIAEVEREIAAFVAQPENNNEQL